MCFFFQKKPMKFRKIHLYSIFQGGLILLGLENKVLHSSYCVKIKIKLKAFIVIFYRLLYRVSKYIKPHFSRYHIKFNNLH